MASRPDPKRWSEDRKSRLCAARVTLNGKPARISRRFERFAFVEQIDSGLGCEWSWAAAERIVDAGGQFWTMRR